MAGQARDSLVKVGLVGLGYWGPKILRNLRDLPGASLEWCADLDRDRLSQAAAQHSNLRTTTNFDEMLASDIDAVVIATPIRTHYPLAKAALLAGKHVMVEKPLTANSTEAAELNVIADVRDRRLMVGHTFQFNEAIRALRDIVASGELGEIYYVDSARLNLGIFQPDINVLWDLAPHDISILMHVLQSDPIAVSARGQTSIMPGIHDVAYLELRFPKNILAHVHLSWLDPCKVRRVTIVGSKKMVVCDDLADVEKIRIYDKGVDRPDKANQFSELTLSYRYGGVTIPYIPVRESLRNQCEHFIACIQDGTRPLTDGHVGRKVVRVLEHADASLQNGGARIMLADEPLAPAGPIGVRPAANDVRELILAS